MHGRFICDDLYVCVHVCGCMFCESVATAFVMIIASVVAATSKTKIIRTKSARNLSYLDF